MLTVISHQEMPLDTHENGCEQIQESVTTSADKDVRNGVTCTADGKGQWCSHCGNQCGKFLKNMAWNYCLTHQSNT